MKWEVHPESTMASRDGAEYLGKVLLINVLVFNELTLPRKSPCTARRTMRMAKVSVLPDWVLSAVAVVQCPGLGNLHFA